MQPGLTRAVPAAILGFLAAVVFVILIRALQGMSPVFDPEVGFVLGAFASAFAFVWGMGAGDPRMQEHVHGPEVDPETGLILLDEHDVVEELEAEGEPLEILGFSVWQVTFWTLLLLAAIFAFANLPTGLTMRISNDPAAQASEIGSENWEIPVLGVETQLSQAATLLLIVFAIIGGLVIIGGGLAMMMTNLHEGVKEVEQLERTALPETPTRRQLQAEADAITAAELVRFGGLLFVFFLLLYYVFVGVPISEPGWLRLGLAIFFAAVFAGALSLRPLLGRTIGERVLKFLLFVGLAGVLYVAFYYVLIGLPIAGPAWLRISLSVINAVGAAFTIVYPQVLIAFVGRTAGQVAKALRNVPAGLGQK